MNKKILVLLIGIIAVMTGLLFYDGRVVKAIGAMLRSGADVSMGSLRMRTSDSTTSPLFLQNGLGTTTLTFASDTFKSLTMYLQVFASSSNRLSPLSIQFAASDDNIDFFNYDPTLMDSVVLRGITATSSMPLASTTIPYTFQPATRGATSTKTVNVNILPARYTRVTFTVASGTPTIGGAPYYKDGLNLWANFVGQMEDGR